MTSRLRYLAALLAVGLVATSCTGEDGSSGGGQYPRNETLYTSGNAWEPPTNWNPIVPGIATGTQGLVYEPLFLFNPETLKLDPWLAEKGEWAADNKTYTITLREGVKWSDGKDFTAEDVKYTTELGKIKAVPFSNLWNYLSSVDAVDARTVRYTFSDPRVQEFENFLYDRMILPKHIWQSRSEQDLTTHKNEKPIGTGPYVYQTHAQDRMVWKKRDGWWAEKALNLEVKPTYVVDIVNSSNEVALGLLTSGRLDLSNNFLPGVTNLVKGDFKIKTFYPEPPYMLSANTAMLIPNTKKAPLNDKAFRRALAQSIDTKKIVEGVYSNIVKAVNPTGLLPVFDQYVDQSVASQSGFTYDTNAAKSTLSGAGYRDTNGDGKVEAPGGKAISLKLIVPSGWTDWMEAARVIAEGAQAAGINVTAEFPDAAALDDARTRGTFDLLLNNWTQVSNTPWTYYNYLFQLPVQQDQFSANFERYENPQAWNLVQQLARTPSDDPAYKATIGELQKIHLTELPAIPLWYNGMWAQYSESVWTNWPSSAPGAPKHFPCTWNDIWELGAVKMLTQIRPVASK
ncbi:ABC transporter substrate-binding protein [Phytohabitans houttuyneae]|uniref:ABC transporter substrate-binding protein n=1 Tax=Phytohabitans houttuyneae TaxID=1076126 RepID=A0A6V8KNU8_9ACTN|nr:ABC transporter substrate-binding protein [Phytohabitans houttuyneae]GFJ83437.1 ABC transporter substrate-binding protein [Phytohabitans houttuyneae]